MLQIQGGKEKHKCVKKKNVSDKRICAHKKSVTKKKDKCANIKITELFHNAVKLLFSLTKPCRINHSMLFNESKLQLITII